MNCPGTLIWFSVGDPEDAAILECSHCGYFLVTGSYLDESHINVPVLREGWWGI